MDIVLFLETEDSFRGKLSIEARHETLWIDPIGEQELLQGFHLIASSAWE